MPEPKQPKKVVKKRPPKTVKEKAFVRLALKTGDPVAAAQEVYNVSSRDSARAIASQKFQKLSIAEMMERREALRDEALLDKLEEGLNAVKRVTSPTEPDAVDVDYAVRHKWWESAMKLKGHMQKDDTAKVNFNFFMKHKETYEV